MKLIKGEGLKRIRVYDHTKRRNLAPLLFLILCLLVLFFLLTACAKASGSSGNHAEIIASPDGSTCYGIFDGDGNLKGGTCK